MKTAQKFQPIFTLQASSSLSFRYFDTSTTTVCDKHELFSIKKKQKTEQVLTTSQVFLSLALLCWSKAKESVGKATYVLYKVINTCE